jgi:TP901 family phage tail tape measure protein
MADEQIVTRIVAKADLSSLVSEVHRATASLQQLQRELLTSNKSIAAATKVSNNMFSDTLVKSGLFSSHFVNLTSDVDKFGKNLDSGRLKLKDFGATFRQHVKTSGGLIRELAKEQVMLQNAVLQPLGRNAQGLMQFNVAIPRGLDLIRNKTALANMEMQIMNRALSEGSTSLINWGKNTQWAGRQLTVGLTVPLTMFGASAAKAFREADAELVRLTKVYGDVAGSSAQDLSRIRKEVVETSKELSKAMGVNFKDTIALAADIAATGKTGNELLGSVKETTRLAVLGEIDRQDAMKATLAIQTAFKQNTQELSESINFLNAVENQTSTTLNDLVEAIPKAGPVIKGLGGDVQDLALYLTAMREGGISASEGANALKSGLASMINPTKQTTAMMKDFGVDILGMVEKNAGSTTGMLLDLQGALDKLDPLNKARAIEQLFGKFQFARISALLNNLGKEGSQTLQVMDLMKASSEDLANVAGRELSAVTESASGKYKRAIEGLKSDMAIVGEQFLKIGTIIIGVIDKVVNFFSMLPKPLKQALTFLGGLTAVAGPLIMLTGVLANFFGYIIKGLVHLRAFFKGASGWKMLTPEIIAAEKASSLVEKAFYSDAAAAQVLDTALKKLISDYAALTTQMQKGVISTNPSILTTGGSMMMAGSPGRQVNPESRLVGDQNTRAMAHILPRDPSNPASLMGVVPAAIPVNRAIQRAPQVYMQDRLPNVEGLTSVKGISTGIVSGEAAKFHALMATLGMQTQQEVAALKKTIALGGTVSSELLGTFDDILPITQKFTQQAASGSAVIVAELKAGKISVDTAKARIMALNAEIEAMMGSALTSFAAGRGRSLNLTKAPLMNQPVVDASGQFTLRDLYKKESNRLVMEEFGRLRGIRTFGAPYSIETTRLPKFNEGGGVETFGSNKTVVSGPTSINYDDRLGSVPVGGYVLNQRAALDPANADLVAMAPQTHFNGGGNITAQLTPGEVVFGPKIQKDPDLYAAVDAANNGYNFGGQIKNGLRSYGRKNPTGNVTNMRETPAYYRKVLGQYIRFINDPRYDQNVRMRMIMLDTAEYSQYMSPKSALNLAIANFDSAKSASGGSQERFIAARIAQVKAFEKKFPQAVHPSGNTRVANSFGLNKNLNSTRAMMLRDPRFANVADLIEQIPKTWGRTSASKPGSPIPFLSSKELQYGNVRGHLLRNGELPYATRGFAGVAAVLPYDINSFLNRMDQIKLMPDILHLNQADAKSSLMGMIDKAGMSKMTSLDDIAMALSDTHKFRSAKDLAANPNAPRATPTQRQHLKMLLTAVSERKKWVMRGRPPMPMLANFNGGGAIMSKIAARVLSSRFRRVQPTNFGELVTPSSGHSFPVPGIGGVWKKPDGAMSFVKPVLDERAALAELRATEIARRAHGLRAPKQTIRTMIDPTDEKGKRRVIVLESPYDPKLAVGGRHFTQKQYIRQLVASLVRNDKDLSSSNVFGNVMADAGPGGVFGRASGLREYNYSLPSMEQQATVNLLGVKGGARKDFANATAPIVRAMTPDQYNALMIEEINKVLPKLKKVVGSFKLTKVESALYQKMIKRLEAGRGVDWRKYHEMHSQVPGFNGGGAIGNVLKGLAMRRIGAGFGPTGAPKPSMYESAPWGVNSLSIEMAEKLFASSGLRKNTQKLLYDKFAAALAKEKPYGYVKGPNGELKNALEPSSLDSVIRMAASDLISDRNVLKQLSPIDKDILRKKYLNWESKKNTPITAELQKKIFGIDAKREMGGPVSPGQNYLVGEKGPEIFSPQQSGNILPGYMVGGLISRAKTAYGKKGNPAARAEQIRLKAERAAAYNSPSGSSYTASGNPQMQVSRVPYVGGTGVRGNAYQADFTSSAARTISTMRLAQFPHMNMPTMPMNIPGIGNTAAITQAFKDLSTSVSHGAKLLKQSVATSGSYIGTAYADAGKSMGNAAKDAARRAGLAARQAEIQFKLGRSLLRNEAYQQHAAAGTMDKYRPGMVTGPIGLTPWQSRHVEGVGNVETRKSGYLGFRKTQYQLDGQSLTRQQAVQAGIAQPRGAMGMGSQMGMMMGGQMAGMALMQKNQNLGMGVMVGSTLLPMMMPQIAKGGAALAKGVGSAASALKGGTLSAKTFVNILTKIKFAGPITGVLALGLAIYKLKKHLDQVHQNTQLTFGMTEKGAEQAGIKYFNLAENMKLVAERQKAMFASASGAYQNSSVPGLTLSVTELKKEKENAKKNLTEFVDTFDTVGKDNIIQTATNIKAQFLAAGMSVEEANKKIYASIAVSKNANMAFSVLSDGGFMGITDKATAARYSVESFAKVLDGSIKESGFDDLKTATIEGISSVINSFSQYQSSLIGTKDELGNVITAADAFKISMEKLASVPGFNKEMGATAFSNLPAEFQAISNSSDSIAGILAKWQLYSSDIVVNFKEISSEAAIGLAAFNSAFATAMTNLSSAAGPATTFSTMGKTLNNLKKIIDVNSRASQRAAAQNQRNAEDEIKLINKKVKAIQDEADAKLKAMQKIQNANNYQMDSQQAQLEYQDAIARGDMAAAAQAQLKQQQLTKEYQMQLAQEAIREDAAKRAEAEQKKAEKVQASIDAAARKAALAAEKSADAQEASSKITGFKGRYESLLQQRNDIQFLDPSKQAAARETSDKNLAALITEIQKSGTGNTLLAKSVKDAFASFFDKNGKPIAATTTTSPSYNGSMLTPGSRVFNPAIGGTIASDIAAANKQADSIVKGIAGGMTLKQLAVAMGLKVPGSTSAAGTTPVKTNLAPKADATTGVANLSEGSVKASGIKKNSRYRGEKSYVGEHFFDKDGVEWKVVGDKYSQYQVEKAGYGTMKLNPKIPTIVGDRGPELAFNGMIIPNMASIPYSSPRYDINQAQKVFPVSGNQSRGDLSITNYITAAEGMDIEALSEKVTMKTVKIIKDMDKNYTSQVGPGRTH